MYVLLTVLVLDGIYVAVMYIVYLVERGGVGDTFERPTYSLEVAGGVGVLILIWGISILVDKYQRRGASRRADVVASTSSNPFTERRQLAAKNQTNSSFLWNRGSYQ